MLDDVEHKMYVSTEDTPKMVSMLDWFGERTLTLSSDTVPTAYTPFYNNDRIILSRMNVAKSDISCNRLFLDKQILRYESRDLSKFASFFTLRGTVFSTRFMWIQVVLFLVLYHGWAMLVWGIFVAIYGTGHTTGVINVYASNDSFLFVTGLMSFMIALYVSNTLTRWWTMRTSGEGAFWAAFNNVCIVLAAHWNHAGTVNDDGDNMKHKATVIRYGLLAHKLIFLKARGINNLTSLIDEGLLTPDEVAFLNGRPAKAKIVWMWLLRYANHLQKTGIVSDCSQSLSDVISVGTIGIECIFTHLDTQLPLVYCHTIALLVKVYLVGQTCVLGFSFALSIINYMYVASDNVIHIGDNTHPIWAWGWGLLQVVVQTILYQGLLDIQDMIADPFGTDRGDYPFDAYQMFLRDECISILDAFNILTSDN